MYMTTGLKGGSVFRSGAPAAGDGAKPMFCCASSATCSPTFCAKRPKPSLSCCGLCCSAAMRATVSAPSRSMCAPCAATSAMSRRGRLAAGRSRSDDGDMARDEAASNAEVWGGVHPNGGRYGTTIRSLPSRCPPRRERAAALASVPACSSHRATTSYTLSG